MSVVAHSAGTNSDGSAGSATRRFTHASVLYAARLGIPGFKYAEAADDLLVGVRNVSCWWT